MTYREPREGVKAEQSEVEGPGRKAASLQPTLGSLMQSCNNRLMPLKKGVGEVLPLRALCY